MIHGKFSIDYHITHVARILHALNWSPQKPERRALERNEAAIKKWKATDGKRIKNSARLGAHLILIDESGYARPDCQEDIGT